MLNGVKHLPVWTLNSTKYSVRSFTSFKMTWPGMADSPLGNLGVEALAGSLALDPAKASTLLLSRA
jgi:hypothetical protein